MQRDEDEVPRVRVMTMNVFAPENPDWERRRPLIARTSQRLAPDVVALQEVPIDSEDVLEDLVGTKHHVTHSLDRPRTAWQARSPRDGPTA